MENGTKVHSYFSHALDRALNQIEPLVHGLPEYVGDLCYYWELYREKYNESEPKAGEN